MIKQGAYFAVGLSAGPAYLLAWVRLGHTASRSCHQPSCQMGLEVIAGRAMTQYLDLACANQTVLGPAKLLLWEHESGPSASHWVPRSVCPSLILQMSNATGWDYYLGTADMNSDCPDHGLVLAKLTPSPSQSGFQYWALHIPLQFVWWEIRVGALWSGPQCWGRLVVHLGFFPSGGTRGSVWYCTVLGRCS